MKKGNSNPKGEWQEKAVRNKMIGELKEKKLSYGQIAKELGISRARVYQIYRQYRIKKYGFFTNTKLSKREPGKNFR